MTHETTTHEPLSVLPLLKDPLSVLGREQARAIESRLMTANSTGYLDGQGYLRAQVVKAAGQPGVHLVLQLRDPISGELTSQRVTLASHLRPSQAVACLDLIEALGTQGVLR